MLMTLLPNVQFLKDEIHRVRESFDTVQESLKLMSYTWSPRFEYIYGYYEVTPSRAGRTGFRSLSSHLLEKCVGSKLRISYLWAFYYDKTEGARCLNAVLNSQYLLSILKDEIHGFVPALQLATDLPTATKLDY